MLQIVNLQAENYKRIKAVNISPEGNVVMIGGRNAQGKTSVLDAIWAALAGGEASRATQQPIREGQDSAVVTLDLGDYIVTRRWTKDDAGTLTVETPPDASGRKQKFSSPQKLLDELVGKRAFDPLAFTRMSAAEQVAALVATVTLPFDPAKLERERKGVFDQRTETKRSVTQLEGQLAGLTAPTDDLPVLEVSVAELLAEHAEARAHNDRLDAAVDSLGKADTAVEAAEAEVARLADALDAARTYAQRAAESRDDLYAKFRSGPERIDMGGILDRINSVEQTNVKVREATEHRRVAAILARKREEVAQLTLELGRIDKQKADALASVKFPIDGLSFDESGVLFNGITFSQASAAEQLRVSTALAMAANPDLRIVQVRDGSLLDSDSMRIIQDLAAEHDYQVWVEVVDESGALGVVIEDGQVRA